MMDVFTLDSLYRPDKLIENYETMIWKERYYGPGDFELHTKDIERTMKLLPLNTMISLRDSDDIQIVENLLIENESLKVTGRTVETVLNRRFVTIDRQDPDYIYNQIEDLVNNVVSVGTPYVPALSIFFVTPGVENTLPPSSPVIFGPQQERFYNREPVYDVIQTMLSELNLSIRASRINPIFLNPPRLQLQVYRGFDRSATGSSGVFPTGGRVILSTQSENVKNATYLITNKNFKNVVTYEVPVPFPDGSLAYYETRRIGIDGYEAEPTPNLGNFWGTQLDLFELYSDTKDTTYMNDMEAIGPNVREEYAKTLALNDLQSRQKITFATAEVSEYSEYKYGTHYGLGDVVTFQGDYGIKEDLMVSEYIRIDDKLGDREYPTLVTPT